MSGQEHINSYRNFAYTLVRHYSAQLQYDITGWRDYLHVLEIAMYKMENELSGRMADIIAAEEENPYINEAQLETGLLDISKSSLKEFLKRCLDIQPAGRQLVKEKAT